MQCCAAAAAAAQSSERGQRQVIVNLLRGPRCFQDVSVHASSPIGTLLRKVRARCLPCACPGTASSVPAAAACDRAAFAWQVIDGTACGRDGSGSLASSRGARARARPLTAMPATPRCP